MGEGGGRKETPCVPVPQVVRSSSLGVRFRQVGHSVQNMNPPFLLPPEDGKAEMRFAPESQAASREWARCVRFCPPSISTAMKGHLILRFEISRYQFLSDWSSSMFPAGVHRR